MLKFSKYEGLGNDFILFDARGLAHIEVLLSENTKLVSQICDRHFGIGADGIILGLNPLRDGDIRMKILNADGSEAEMCGNGIRCLSRFICDLDSNNKVSTLKVETLAGIISSVIQDDGNVSVDMGRPYLEADKIPTTLHQCSLGLPKGTVEFSGTKFDIYAVGMGNPHLIIPLKDVSSIPFESWGPFLEDHPAFPSKTNVHFLEVLDPNNLKIRVWERGAGPTMACGTGACATLVAAHLIGLSNKIANVYLPGGKLKIIWPGVNLPIQMIGPSSKVYNGELDLSSFKPSN